MSEFRNLEKHARENELRNVGLTMMQAAALFIIKSIKGPAIPAEIARWLFREHHTVSALLNRMEKRGLVKKIKGHGRKNIIRVELTKKGEEAYKQSQKLRSIHDIMSCLSDRQKGNLKKYLEALRKDALEKVHSHKLTKVLPFP